MLSNAYYEGEQTSSYAEWSGLMSQSPLAADYDGHNLVLVAGCPRSGTTWLQRLLASHPKIRTGQESNLFSAHVGPQLRSWRKAADPRHRGGVGLGCYFTEAEFILIVKSYLLKLLEPMVAGLAPDELFLEKTPSNALFLPEILELLPRARVIHVLRDARDVVSSMTSGESWFASWVPENARDAAYMWVRYVRGVWDALPKMRSGQFHEVRYETLSRNPVEVLRGTADFLGLDWDFAEISDAVERNRASKARVNGGTPIPVSGEVAMRSGPVVLEPKGFIRRAEAGAWKDDLSLYEKFWVWRVAHQTMAAADYDWPKPMGFAFACFSAPVELAKRLVR
jgi:Sulfotransferase family